MSRSSPRRKRSLHQPSGGVRRPARPPWNWPAITSTITTAIALGALAFTGLSLVATRDQIAITEQGQFTDRYTKAVEQLDKIGPDHLQARLGGLYSLERLARDSPGDQPTIIDVLSAFIRTNTPAMTLTAPTFRPDANSCTQRRVTPDVQTALTVLGRRNTAHDNGTILDLQETCLRGADLRKAQLTRASLINADLADANMIGAVLVGADLTGAHLLYVNGSGADFTNASLERSNLTEARLTGANFMGSRLADASIINADLVRSDFTSASLTNANLTRADLRDARFTDASLYYAVIVNTDLAGADLTRAILVGADLTASRHDQSTRIEGVNVGPGIPGQWW